MMNVIRGVRYHIEVEKLDSEEQLLVIFNHLKSIYNKIRISFKISDFRGGEVKDFSSFLKVATSEDAKVFIKGSGEFAGLEFTNVILEYDLKDVARLTRYWNINARVECENCMNHSYEYVYEGERESRCSKIKGFHSARTCGDNFSPGIKGINGQNPRNLEKIIYAASK